MPGYAVKTQHVHVAGAPDLVIRSLLDNQQYADPLGEAAALGISEASWPLFGLVWPSAQKLADLMQGWELGTQRILEIGCGLGLASLVIQRREGNITASDCHPLTAGFLAANVALNALPPLPYLTGNWGHTNPGLGEFDLIIGSDVLYERDQPLTLAAFIALHAAPAAQVIIIDPNRGNRSLFHRQMALLGFTLNESMIEAPLWDGTPYRGRLLHYQRSLPPASLC
jgi:predicted nicotinamide N-methyase